MNVKIKRLHKDAYTPTYGTNGAAGLDLTAISYKLENGRHVYGTGLAVEIPEGYVGLIFPRSSLSKYDLRLTNCVGVIDSDYRGELIFKFENNNMGWDISAGDLPNTNKNIYKVGDRIGQLVVMSIPSVQLIEVEELSETERAGGSYGSTDIERSQAV